MTSDNWNETQNKLKVWSKTPKPSGWELKQILSESVYHTVILQSTLRLAKKKYKTIESDVNIKDFWGFYLEKFPEKDAISILLDVWNTEVWRHINVTANYEMKNIMGKIKDAAQKEFEMDVEFNKNFYNKDFNISSHLNLSNKSTLGGAVSDPQEKSSPSGEENK